MIQKIKNHVVITLSALLIAMPGLAAATVATGVASAACNGIQNSLNNGIQDTTGTASNACGADTTNTDNNTISNFASKVVNILSVIIGAIAVIFIIIGGFRYITSGGDSSKVGGAKNTIIYALVGLIIVALAQFIVHYVLNSTLQGVGNTQ